MTKILFSKRLHKHFQNLKNLESQIRSVIDSQPEPHFCHYPPNKDELDVDVVVHLLGAEKCKNCTGVNCKVCDGLGDRLVMFMPIKLDNEKVWWVQWKDEYKKIHLDFSTEIKPGFRRTKNGKKM